MVQRGDPDVEAHIERATLWSAEMAAIRPILLGCGLTESIKWGKPCYDHEGANIAILQEMKAFLAVMFFKGALLADPEGVLEEQGPNSRSARRLRITSVDQVARLTDTIEGLVTRALEVEAAGLEVGPAPELVLVAELQDRLDRDPALAEAFEGLSPGRRREYNLHFSDAKQAATRQARVERYAPKILEGKGLRDR
jgi:uncharacterized protein YdeI (YjbR/CyaY-like superfamily)